MKTCEVIALVAAGVVGGLGIAVLAAAVVAQRAWRAAGL